MAINHKFLNHNFLNGFETNCANLDTMPYKPEVMFIGTFNHGWNRNPADFFYGRGMYMWPILANLFIYNANIILNPRNNNLNPTTNQIFEICEKANITFADIVTGTNPAIPVHQVGRSILVDNQYTWNKYSDSQLEYLASQGWLDDNVEQIVNYINNTPTIKHVYFTFKSGRWLSSKMELIKQGITVQTKCSIISPSGNGFGKLLPGYPTKVESLAHCWVWNGLPNIDFINKIGYCPLNHHWLISKGVNPNNF